MIRLFPYARDQFDESQSYGAIFRKKGRGLPDAYILKSLCAHGTGGESTVFRGDFSNNPGSHCSSLGHYRVGRNRNMYRRPVPAFEVHGLDKSNSNALSRGILIHPTVGPLTWGCFGVPVFKYNEISDWLKSMPTNIVLWAYND